MRRSVHLSSIFLILALLPRSLGAATVTGTATDARSGEPLPGATVTVPGAEGATVTGDTGAFTLEGAPEGSFTLVVTSPGHEPCVVRVTPGDVVACRLQPVRYAGEEVVVTASRYGDGVHLSQTSLTAEEIRLRHTVEDVPVLLEDTPGVYATSDTGLGLGYTYLDIRGFDQRRVGVMVNGIPWNDPEDHEVWWVDVPDLAASVEDVQIQRGVTNALGGMSAMAGTVNLVTEVHGLDPAARMALYGGSYGTRRQMLSWRSGLLGGRWSTALRLSHLESDGWRDHSSMEQVAAFWSGRLRTPRSTTTVNVYGGQEVTDQAWTGLTDAQLAEDRTANPETWPGAVDNFRQPHAELHHRWEIAERVTLEQSVYGVHGSGFYENWKDDRTARDFGLDAALGLDPEAEVDLVRRKYVDKDHVGWIPRLHVTFPRARVVLGGDGYLFRSHHYGDVTLVEGFTPAEGAIPYYSWRGAKQSASTYVNVQVEVLPRLTVLLDLHEQWKRYALTQEAVGSFVGEDRHALEAEWAFFNPKGGLHWRSGRLGSGVLEVYTHGGISHREPSDSDLFDVWEGPDDLGAEPLFGEREAVMKGDQVDYIRWSDPRVAPERVLDGELGTAWRSPAFTLAVNGYWMDFQNEIVDYGGLDEDGAAIRGNAARTLHRGVEGWLELHVREAHHLTVAGSRSWDRLTDFTVYEAQWDPDTWEYLGTEAVDLSGNPIAGFPAWLGSVRWVSTLGPATAMVRWRGVGRQYLDNTGDMDRSLDPWQVVDAGVMLSLGAIRGLEEVEVDLRVQNVLDASYEIAGYYDAWEGSRVTIPAVGRNWLLGVRYGF